VAAVRVLGLGLRKRGRAADRLPGLASVEERLREFLHEGQLARP